MVYLLLDYKKNKTVYFILRKALCSFTIKVRKTSLSLHEKPKDTSQLFAGAEKNRTFDTYCFAYNMLLRFALHCNHCYINQTHRVVTRASIE